MHSKTFTMIKPGAVQRGLVGEIIKRFETKGLNIVALKIINVTDEQAEQHYSVHKDKSFYPQLVEYITSGPVVVMMIEGENAVELVRKMAGDTNPLKSSPGTIRGDFSADIENNIIHTADSLENAARECSIYFNSEEILEFQRVTDPWAFEFKKE